MTAEVYGVDEGKLDRIKFPAEGMLSAQFANHASEHGNVIELEMAAKLVHLAGRDGLSDLPISPDEAEDTTSLLRRLPHMRECEICTNSINKLRDLFPNPADFENLALNIVP